MDIVTVYETFPTNDDCIAHIEKVRWGNAPTCPYCKSHKQTPMPKQKRYHCNNCNTSFSVTVGTIFHHTHLPLQKWFLAISIILNAKKGLSARQLGRDLHVNKDTAWRMAMKIRQAMTQAEQRKLLTGVVEADETYIGGKPRKGNSTKGGGGNKRGRGTKKTPVVGVASRNGQVRAESFHNRNLTHRNLKALIRKNVDCEGAVLMTDQFRGYIGIGKVLPHKTIDHTDW
jgi:transposase-like protein